MNWDHRGHLRLKKRLLIYIVEHKATTTASPKPHLCEDLHAALKESENA